MGTSCSSPRCKSLPTHMVDGPSDVAAAFTENVEWQSVSYYVYIDARRSGTILYHVDTSCVEIYNDSIQFVDYIETGDPCNRWYPPNDEFVDASNLIDGYSLVSDTCTNHISLVKKEGQVRLRYLVTVMRGS